MKKNKIVALLMSAIVIISCFAPIMTTKGEDYLIDVIKGTSKVIEGEPGKTVHVKLPVQAILGFITSPVVLVSPPSGAPYTASTVTLTKDSTQGDITYITSYDTTYLEFDLTIKETVKIGYYDVPIIIEFEDYLYDEGKKRIQLDMRLHITKEKQPSQLTVNKVEYSADDAFIGNTFDITFTIKNEGEITALNTYFNINFGATGLSPAYTVDSQKLGDIKGGATAKVTLPVTILPTAEEGFKTISANFTYKDIEGIEGSDSRNVYVTVQQSTTGTSENAKLSITSDSYQENIMAGSDYSITASVENIGAKAASSVKISIIGGVGAAEGILPGYNQSEISLSDILPGQKQSANIPLIISTSATAGLHEIILQVSYTDTDNISRSAVTKAYLMIERPKEEEEEKETSGIDFSSVSQSPANPIVGERVTVSFKITNTGMKDIANIRLWGEGLSSANFEPLNSEPYQKAGDLKVGESRDVSMTFYVGNMIAEGLNTLKIGYSFDDGGTELKTGVVSFYILNVVNDSNSKPKLILTEFSIDTEMIKAGDIFTFTFDLMNTHISKAAKNIKITLESVNDVFSATTGSVSFYVDKIEPSAVYNGKVELKAKSDVATGSYELKIEVEYEYDNMSVADIEKGGVTASNPIKLSVVENSRPVIQYPQVFNWYEPVRVNSASTMTFSFYNMGKSTLNNVFFTLEGDFVFVNQMEFYGSLASGTGGEYLEYEVMPINSGLCGGTIQVHFEDSNGNEVVRSFDFTDIYVEPEQTYDNNQIFPDDGYMPVDTLPSVEVKEDILPLWMFIVIQVAVLIIITPVVRIIIIKAHRRKLMKIEDKID